ncbi:lytic murein transglycosylase B [Marinobacter lacisalsi]|uniref:Lytic murein transglycosylase B n=1 Tax=Marinobacter lacisalsi TaxID=475979 RepID=A0ABV8QIH9_9GAMM
MKHLKFPILLLVVAAMAPSLRAADGYTDRPEFEAFVDDMARKHAFDADRVRQWLGEARHQPRIIELISTPAERTLEWHEYRAIFIKPGRVQQGVAFLQEHQDAFRRAETESGVPREIIAAIIGVETWYGRYLGSHRVLDALATLAFDYPPRSRFFRSELEQFFLMVREQGFDPTQLKGSYAGAMGYGQFIASSYRHYAVDFDGDDVADILGNPVDAIGSVANYFEEHHWRSGGPVAMRLADNVQVPDRLMTRELKPRFTVSDFRSAGVKVPGSVAGNEPARVIRLEGQDGPQWWLTFHNFYVITRYNHSHLYAMAVQELAGELEQGLAGAADSGVGPDDKAAD